MPSVWASTSQTTQAGLIGQVLGQRYRIDKLIGEGGMGWVFLGEHVTLRMPVAIKVLQSSLAGVAELRGRFEREAAAIGRVDHPNCIRIFDYGTTDAGELYLVMEYLRGQSLETELTRTGSLPIGRAVAILRQLLEGLAHIHEAGIVHRDIKSDNVILTREGTTEVAHLIDFGIAKLLTEVADDNVALTQAGVAFGTPVYMSPEQAMGETADVRADLYSVSVLAYEMLAGQPPFMADDKLQLMGMHATRPAPPMRERQLPAASPIPTALEQVILFGLAKSRAERFQSAREYLAAVNAAMTNGVWVPTRLQTSPVVAARTNRTTPLPNSVRRAQWPIWLVAGVVTLGVGAAVLAMWRRDTRQSAVVAARTEAGLLLELGHSQAEGHAALAKYEQAVAQEPALCGQTELAARLHSLTADTDEKIGVRAMRLQVLCGAEPAQLASDAVASDSYERRQAGAALARANGTTINWQLLYSRDLADGPDCEARHTALVALAALGDPIVVPTIEEAMKKKGKKPKGNQCLMDDARAAISRLRPSSY